MDRVYHSWQVYRPDEAVSDRGSRASWLAGLSPREGGIGSRIECPIAGRFITPRRRSRIVDRVYHGWQVYRPEEAVSDRAVTFP